MSDKLGDNHNFEHNSDSNYIFPPTYAIKLRLKPLTSMVTK